MIRWLEGGTNETAVKSDGGGGWEVQHLRVDDVLRPSWRIRGCGIPPASAPCFAYMGVLSSGITKTAALQPSKQSQPS